MEEKKLTKKELKAISDSQNDLHRVTTNVGILETQKHALLHEIAGVNQKIEEIKKELEEKYGPININLEDGTFETVEKENE
tara:strand:+ start:4442 stop:4684 length:243 start_codon:yes stop_codon:yes gene_type:complete